IVHFIFLIYLWFIARAALRIDPFSAIGMVFTSYVLSFVLVIVHNPLLKPAVSGSVTGGTACSLNTTPPSGRALQAALSDRQRSDCERRALAPPHRSSICLRRPVSACRPCCAPDGRGTSAPAR